MTRAERSAIAKSRRDIARSMRAAGKTWADIGRHLGVTAPRAKAIAEPVKSAGNHKARAVYVWWTGTLGEYIDARVKRIEECVAAHGGGR